LTTIIFDKKWPIDWWNGWMISNVTKGEYVVRHPTLETGRFRRCPQNMPLCQLTFSQSLHPTRFPLALDIGAGSGYIYQAICSDDAFGGQGGIGGVRKLVQLDSSEVFLRRDEHEALDGSHRCDTYRLHADEEGTLPFPDGTFDLVLSSQSMHWVNDLPGLFREVKVRVV
jgi:SAM-dependent methyltransferase